MVTFQLIFVCSGECFSASQHITMGSAHVSYPVYVSSSIIYDPTTPSYQLISTATTLCSDRGEAMLLQTACTTLHNPSDPQISTEVWLLFDSGSLKSYVTEQAKRLLALEPTGEQLLHLDPERANEGT